MPEALRKTRYAELCNEARLPVKPGEELRLEKIWVKDRGQEVIRWSWWKGGRMIPRPPDMTEEQLLVLLERGGDAGVFSTFFYRQLLQQLERRAEAIFAEQHSP